MTKILQNAQKHAMIDTEGKYVFNEIYFGAEGMTSTSAQHVSAMANVMVNDIKERLNGLRLYQKSIRVIGENETVTEVVNNTLPEIPDGVKRISKANALIAWLREATKERQNGIDAIANIKLDEWLKANNREMPDAPEIPPTPKVNFNDINTILGTGLTVKEYNRFLELESTLAVYGEMVHERGLLTAQKKKLHEIAKSPTEVKESGRDTIITTYQIDDSALDLERVYVQLQQEYRKLQAEKNGIASKFEGLAANYQTRQIDQYNSAMDQYRKDMVLWTTKKHDLELEMAEWKKREMDRIVALKIILPRDLNDIYAELKEKYL